MELGPTTMDGPAGHGDKVGLINDDPPKRTTKKESTDSDSTRAESSPLHKGNAGENQDGQKSTLQSFSLRVIIVSAIVFAVAVTVSLILTIYLGPPQIGEHAAVASDVGVCSDMGLVILKKGGNAVDAAVTTLLCLGVVNSHSSGLGGGGFMLVYDHKIKQSTAYDFRETAPRAAKDSLFPTRASTMTGGRSVAVPGELRGLEMAHKDFEQKLTWSEVVLPAADLARKGFNVTRYGLANTLKHKFKVDDFKGTLLGQLYVRNNQFVTEGTFIVRPDLANTLDAIAEKGADEFYKGEIAKSIVKAVKAHGGVMTMADMVNYQVMKRQVLTTSFRGSTVVTLPAPTSGPILLLMLNMMERFNWTQANISDASTYHNMTEIFKYSYAHQGLLGDPDFVPNMRNTSLNIIAKKYAIELANLVDNETHPISHYHPLYAPEVNKGTTHLSVVDTSELMVSVTSTINEFFGSKVTTTTGILLNNEMADFSFPNFTRIKDLPPNKNNFLEPGEPKRPLSSMVPTIIYNPGYPCALRMAIGGSNGRRIIAGVAETIANVMAFGMGQDIARSIERPRIYDDLYSNRTEYEALFLVSVVDDMKKMGHNMVKVSEGLSVVQAVAKVNDAIFAHSDSRKGGKAALF
ncbi:glutathione hydrolase 1 proenzyme-like [Haliotis rubra]|uniref:glutathione hydrolase 1 proenzyme-like n=1 Tax=Haliotis rubra TaxID=36100 RepID=UPI001EE62C69|nr:glutathione hydrolase 1 proenzyme-like [Haliotis rubra]